MSYSEFISLFPQYNFLKPLFDNEIMVKKNWNKGEIFCHCGEPLDSIFFFISGKSKAYRPLNNGKDVVYAPYCSGDIAGDIEYITGDIATGSLISNGNLIGYQLIKAQIPKNIDDKLFKIISIEVSKKLVKSSLESTIRTGYSGKERVAYYLLNKYENGTFSMDDIAGILGITYRHLSRILKKLSDSNLIAVNNRSITIIDRDKLLELTKNIKEDY